jgi:hypothetical protein
MNMAIQAAANVLKGLDASKLESVCWLLEEVGGKEVDSGEGGGSWADRGCIFGYNGSSTKATR